MYRVNVEGSRELVAACLRAGVRRLVYVSTIKTLAVSDPSAILNEEAPLILKARSAYDVSKAEAERIILVAATSGLEAVILNPTAIIGPYDRQPSYLGQALLKIGRNSFPMLVKGGYDFVDVRDVVMAAMQAAEVGKTGERYILSGKWFSIMDISAMIAEITGQKTPKYAVPLWLAKACLPFIRLYALLSGTQPLFTAEALENLSTASKHIDNNKARQDLGFMPRPIRETLTDTFTWFEQNNQI